MKRPACEEDEPLKLPSTQELRQLPHWQLMEQIKNGYSALSSRAHKVLRRELALNYHRAWFLANDSAAYKAFCTDPGWLGHRNRPRPNRPEEALQHVLRAARGYDGANATSCVSKWFKRLEPLWDASIPPLEAADIITRKRKPPSGVQREMENRSFKRRASNYVVLHLPPDGVGRQLREGKPGDIRVVKLRIEGMRGAALKVSAWPVLLKRRRP